MSRKIIYFKTGQFRTTITDHNHHRSSFCLDHLCGQCMQLLSPVWYLNTAAS